MIPRKVSLCNFSHHQPILVKSPLSGCPKSCSSVQNWCPKPIFFNQLSHSILSSPSWRQQREFSQEKGPTSNPTQADKFKRRHEVHPRVKRQQRAEQRARENAKLQEIARDSGWDDDDEEDEEVEEYEVEEVKGGEDEDKLTEEDLKKLREKDLPPGAVPPRYRTVDGPDGPYEERIEEGKDQTGVDITRKRLESYRPKTNETPIEPLEIVEVLRKEAAIDIFVINVTDKCSWTKYLVVCTGRSYRHMRSIGDSVLRTFKHRMAALNGRMPSVEDPGSTEWHAIDGGDICVHVFSQSGRDYYDIEKLWALKHDLELSDAIEPDDLPSGGIKDDK